MGTARHLLEQGPMLAALGRTAFRALAPSRASGPVTAPGPWHSATVAAPSPSLVADFVRQVGGDPSAYRSIVPFHMFPQWGLPLASRAMAGLPYPIARVVNAGVKIDRRSDLPAGGPILVRARIESIDVDARRAIVVQRIVSGTPRDPEAIVADVRAFVPLGRPDPSAKKNGAGREEARVPGGAREIAFGRIGADAGLEYAYVTGDLNPIHWLAPYARAAGFRAPILHGFASLSRAISAIERRVFAGDARALRQIDVRFVKPLVLPAKVGVYVSPGGTVFVGDAPSGDAYLTGKFTPDPRSDGEETRT